MHTRTARAAAIALLTAATLVLTSCMAVQVEVSHNADGSGTAQMSATLEPELTSWLGDDVTADDIKADLIEGVDPAIADRADITVTDTDDGITITVDYTYNDPAELEALLTSGDTPDDQLFATFELAETDGSWELDATTNIGDADATTDSDNPADEFTRQIEEAFGNYTAEFTITLPGTIGDSNADTVNGNTATWDLTTGDGTLTAQSSGGGSNNLPRTIGLALAGLAIIGLAAAAIIVYTRRSTAAPANPSAAYWDDLDERVAAEAEAAEREAAIRAIAPIPGPGWYTDPDNPTRTRWWDGTAWGDGPQL